ncbi:MAG: XdhC family protein [Candidatus Methanomethylicia archaeon]
MKNCEEELFSKINEILKNGKRLALCIIVEKIGSGPRDIGTKMVVYNDGKTMGSIGGGILERIIIQKALESIKLNKNQLITLSLGGSEGIETGLICGGSIKVFINVINPKPRLIIIGSGHIAKPLAEIAHMVGFEIVILDDSEEEAIREIYPMASKIIVKPLIQGLEEINLSNGDFVAIVHGEVEKEYDVIKKILERNVEYIGLLGSRRKGLEFKRRLKDEGFKEEVIEKINVPIGIDIGAETPEEIAVSIVAELIKVLRNKK